MVDRRTAKKYKLLKEKYFGTLPDPRSQCITPQLEQEIPVVTPEQESPVVEGSGQDEAALPLLEMPSPVDNSLSTIVDFPPDVDLPTDEPNFEGYANNADYVPPAYQCTNSEELASATRTYIARYNIPLIPILLGIIFLEPI